MKSDIFKRLGGFLLITSIGFSWAIAEPNKMDDSETSKIMDSTPPSDMDADEAPKMDVSKDEEGSSKILKPTASNAKKRVDRAQAFVAGADWEFDGFVAGGQDSNVRSMFYMGDLIYLNIGSQQGVGAGDRVGIYKRGEKVRDPQTGRFLGYEVRRAAIARATDKVEDEAASVRITMTYEPVEIGDLVRREE